MSVAADGETGKDILTEIEEEYAVSPDDVFSVSDLNQRISRNVEADPDIADIHVLGEVSNLSTSSGGHLFFDLKDEDTCVSCVFFGYEGDDLELKDGDRVLVKGTADYYAKRGEVSFKAATVHPVGEGIYYQKLRKRIKKLRKEGLFDKKHKQEVPELPEKIGVVTSKDGAAVRDIINTIHDRYPDVDIYVKHSAVQGERAVEELCEGVRFFDDEFAVDVVVIGRGGGSIEDLQAFNAEELARIIFKAETPVVSGVGHRTDETITGFVADCGAITPTAAGKAVVPRKAEKLRDLEKLAEKLESALEAARETEQAKRELQVALSRERKYQVALAVSVLLNITLLWWLL